MTRTAEARAFLVYLLFGSLNTSCIMRIPEGWSAKDFRDHLLKHPGIFDVDPVPGHYMRMFKQWAMEERLLKDPVLREV